MDKTGLLGVEMGTRTVWLIFMLCSVLLLGACASETETTPNIVASEAVYTIQIATETTVSETVEASNTQENSFTGTQESSETNGNCRGSARRDGRNNRTA